MNFGERPFEGTPPKGYAGFYEPIPCMIRQWGDRAGCTTPGCGLRWATNDPNPPRCPRLAVARGRVAPGRHYPSTPSPSPHQKGLLGLLLAIMAALAVWIGT